MNYQSTRNKDMSVSSAMAIKTGISPDGGLFVPSENVSVTLQEIEKISTYKYTELAKYILSKFLTDYTEEELNDCVTNAYTAEKFETDTIAPVYKLNDSAYILELWHGPTCAFKDMALQILPHFLTKAIEKTGEKKEVVILVATSGDTGKAALEGFKNVKGTKIEVFYPNNGVSKIQKLQMATQEGDNVCVVAVNGNFDDAQTGVKKIFTDEAYIKELDDKSYMLSSANSINWGRLVPQIVYYFAAYCSMLKNGEIGLGDKINICVPTGNFGNILAAYYAKSMGLPVGKLICASNKNNVLTDFINTGIYDKNRKFETTVSPSMDILISSNLERFLFLVSGKNDALVREYMDALKNDGKYEVTDEIKKLIADTFYGGFCSDDDTLSTIREIKDKYDYLVDTHTAVGCNIYEKYAKETGDNTKTVIASTASPFKFNESVLTALGYKEKIGASDEFELLNCLSEISGMRVPKSLGELKNKFVRFNSVCEKEDMKSSTNEFLNI